GCFPGMLCSMRRLPSQLLQPVIFAAISAAMTVFASPSTDDDYWDGTVGVASSGAVGIWAVASAAAGEFYTAGYFTSLNGESATNNAHWTGNRWQALGSGLGGQGDETVRALAASGRTLYAAGVFDNAGILPLSNLARWDGSTWKD